MLKHYLKLAWRNLIRNKFNNVLNALGLTLGVTCFLIIFTKVDFESGFDQFHTDTDRIYRVVRVTSGLAYLEGALEYRTGVNFPLPNAIESEIPELEEVTQVFHFWGNDIKVLGDGTTKPTIFKEIGGFAYVEPSLFKVLDFNHTPFKWLIGSPEESLKEPFSIVLTESIAQKYFGNDDPIGKQLEIRDAKYKVSGLITDFPQNSDFRFKLLASMSTMNEVNKGLFTFWNGLSDGFQCLVKLQKGTDPLAVEQKIKAIHKANTSAETADFRLYELQPLVEIHTDSRFGNFSNRVVSDSTILSLMSIGILLIIMACINYSNLSITQLASRGKSVGINKMLGNTRNKQILQMLFETFVLTLITTGIGIILSVLAIRNFSDLIGVPANWNFFGINYVLFLLFIAVIVSVAAGIYPASLISKTKPVEMIRNKGFSTAKGGARFSRWMVTFQFVIAQILIVCGLVIFRQLNFIESKDMGYDRKNIIVLNLPGNDQLIQERFGRELMQNPQITAVSFSSVSPSREGNFINASRIYNGENVVVDVEEKAVDRSFIKTYGLRLISGKNFEEGMSGYPIIANQKLINELHFEDENAAIGQIVQVNGDDVIIIGVVEDFHSSPIYDPIRPCLLHYRPQNFDVAGIRFSTSGDQQAHEQVDGLLADLKEKWLAAYPNDIFEYQFFDESIASYYKDEKRTASLVHIFTGVMIIICCLGIIGLIHYTTVRKAKEVAVRKIIGATVPQITRMLLTNFTEWVIIANVVAWPIAWFMMDQWLKNFAYQTEITWWIFLLSGVIALVIALLTVGFHILRAASVNPVKILKYE
ncbi:MAG: ABC transporter permease [Bacteroidota bacterium]